MAASRTGFPGTISSGDPVSSSDNNTLPGGLIGYASVGSDSAGTTTTETITSVTVDVGTDRQIEVRVKGMLQSDTANSGGQVRINLDGTQIERKDIQLTQANINEGFEFSVQSQPSAGSHTYAFITGVSGSGPTVTLKAAGDQLAQITVADIGPAFT